MSTEKFLTDQGAIDISCEAAASLASKQFFAVKENGSNQVAICGANEKALGILQNAPAAGETAIVRISGVSKCKLAQAVVMGNYLTPTADGDAEICDAANENYFARALGTFADNDIAEVQLCFGEVTATDE